MASQTAAAVIAALDAFADPQRALGAQRYFKTGPGEYGEGDAFIGVTVPDQRRVAKRFGELPTTQITRLLRSAVHEHRLTGCLILAGRAVRADRNDLREILELYLGNAARVNNWDLVDSSAPQIVGRAVLERLVSKARLRALAASPNLWERRIAVLATLALIRQDRFDEILDLSERLLDDEHDLIHKAVGWMLREVGHRSQSTLTTFLDRYAERMPRTMLRYAIERLPEPRRRVYLGRKRIGKSR